MTAVLIQLKVTAQIVERTSAAFRGASGMSIGTPPRECSLVEAAGVEPASEAVSNRISTSVSRILVLARRLLLTGSAFASLGRCPASRPRRPRCGNPVCFNAVPQSAGLTEGDTRYLSTGTHVSTAYAARAKVVFLLAFVKTLAL